MNPNHNIIPKQNSYSLKKELISIHSSDRDISKWKNTNHFEINLPNNINNINYIKLTNITLPMNQYNVSSSLKNTKFRFSYNSTDYEVEIEDGFYSGSHLANSIQYHMNKLTSTTNFVVKHNKVTNKFLFGSKDGAITLDFNYKPSYNNCITDVFDNYDKWGLGYLIGFEKSTYNSTQTTTSLILPHEPQNIWLLPTSNNGHYIEPPNHFNILMHDTIYVELDKYNNISEIEPFSKNTMNSYNNDLSFKNNSAFAKIPIPLMSSPSMLRDDNNYHTIMNLKGEEIISNKKNYFPPIKSINRLRFKFRYHNGELVDFNNIPLSMMIEIGVLQEEHLRNVIIRREF